MWKWLFILSIALVGCKARHKLISDAELHPDCKYASYDKKDVLSNSDSNEIDFTWLKIKAKVDAEFNEQSLIFQVQLRIRKDSLVYAKISKSGFTGVKLLATHDTIILVDKLNKQYFTGHYSSLDKILGISVPFEVLQNLLLGNPTFLYEEEGFKKIVEPLISYSSKRFDLELFVDTLIHQVQSFTCDSLRLSTVGVLDGRTKKEVWISYSDFGDINGYLLNKKIELKGIKGDKQLILSDIEIKRVKAFPKLDAPIEIQDDFKPMEIK